MYRTTDGVTEKIWLVPSPSYVTKLDNAHRTGQLWLTTILTRMHDQLIESRGLPEGSLSLANLLEKIPAEDWEVPIQILSYESDKWKSALKNVKNQYLYSIYNVNIIYTIILRSNYVNIHLSEFFVGTKNRIGYEWI